MRVQDFEPHGLLKTRVYIDLVGKDEDEAKQTILEGFKEDGRPKVPPSFPPFSTHKGFEFVQLTDLRDFIAS